MPTVVVLDVSLSMSLPVTIPDSTDTYTSLQLAVHGINSLLDYLALYSKLEFVALVSMTGCFRFRLLTLLAVKNLLIGIISWKVFFMLIFVINKKMLYISRLNYFHLKGLIIFEKNRF